MLAKLDIALYVLLHARVTLCSARAVALRMRGVEFSVGAIGGKITEPHVG